MLCEFLRKHAMKITNFKKKKMKLLTKEEHESCENAKICYICKEKFENKYLKDKKYRKVRYYCHYTGEYRGATHSKNKFILLLQKGVYPYEYMDDWEKFNETLFNERLLSVT